MHSTRQKFTKTLHEPMTQWQTFLGVIFFGNLQVKHLIYHKVIFFSILQRTEKERQIQRERGRGSDWEKRQQLEWIQAPPNRRCNAEQTNRFLISLLLLHISWFATFFSLSTFGCPFLWLCCMHHMSCSTNKKSTHTHTKTKPAIKTKNCFDFSNC